MTTPTVPDPGATPGDFYEDDEPVEDVIAAFEAGEKGLTARPSAGQTVNLTVPLGPCGDPAPLLSDQMPQVRCDLRAGHIGWHEGGEHRTSWTRRDQGPEAEVAKLRVDLDAAGKQAVRWGARFDEAVVMRDERQAMVELQQRRLVEVRSERDEARKELAAHLADAQDWMRRRWQVEADLARMRPVVEAAKAWVDRLHQPGCIPPNQWADEYELALIAAVDQMATPTGLSPTETAQNGEVVPEATPDLVERLTPRIVELVETVLREELR